MSPRQTRHATSRSISARVVRSPSSGDAMTPPGTDSEYLTPEGNRVGEAPDVPTGFV